MPHSTKSVIRRCILRSAALQYVTARLLATRLAGTLEKCGYVRSQLQGECVDSEGKPIPWFPYPVIDFLSSRVHADMTVFEFGSGNSTLWWSKRVARVISCEHDAAYYESMTDNLPGNVDYLHRSIVNDSSVYEDTIRDYPKQVDVVVIDGVRRTKCARNCLSALKENGVIIFDNSDYRDFKEGLAFLKASGFRALAIRGLTALQTWENETTFFYKEDNVLAI